jgi:alpha-tubulin suppressor-like RCC1 family protein
MPTPEEIQTCINNLTSNNEITEMVILAAQTDQATEDRSIIVEDGNSLPDLLLTSIEPGTIFFVESLGIPVVANTGCWLGLNNEVIRKDILQATAWAWGCNTTIGAGQLGDGTTVSRRSPVSVVGGFTDWCQVSAGGFHSLGVLTNTPFCQTGAQAWGNNCRGQLGTGNTFNRSSPVAISGFLDWCQVSAGKEHSLAVRQNGTAWAWGLGTCGRLGDDTILTKSSPVSVVGDFTDWCQVSGGDCHSLGLRQNGTAWAWGRGTYGVLGDNSTVAKSSPVSVIGDFTDWCQVSAGIQHSLALRQNGTAWAWGSNGQGRLGDNTIVSKLSPVSVVGGFTDWCQVSAGNSHSLGVRENGTAWAWGCNSFGQLGDDTITSQSSPVSVVGGFTDWCQVSAGGFHSLGTNQEGLVWAWGCNGYGQLGDNTTVSKRSPVSVVGDFTDWCQVSAGYKHSLGLRRY